jgi:hypothetical protein
MIFCNPRFDDVEMARLYSGYRGERYTSVREQYEPGYTERNDKIAKDPGELRARRAFCLDLLQSVDRKYDSVLDYGGDRGQFIPPALEASRKYVYEVSGVTPEEGIQAVDNPAAHAPYDLVMCCHVLEHVASPVDLLSSIADLVSDTGAIYLEVPAGIPAIRYFQAALFRSELKKRRQNFHEHVNAFTQCSLRNMMLAAGVRPITSRVSFLDLGWTRTPVIGAVGVRSGAAKRPAHGRIALALEGVEYALKKAAAS